MALRKFSSGLVCSRTGTAILTLSLLSGAFAVAANVRNEFLDLTEDMMVASSWSLSQLPTAANDAVLVPDSYAGDHAINSGNLTVGSLNVLTDQSSYLIRNKNTGSINSTLTLGGAGNTGNAVSGTPGDLLYVPADKTLYLENTNNAGGTGVLQLALGQTGNFNIAGEAYIRTVTSGAFGINKTGAGKLFLPNTASTFSGGLTIKEGTVEFTSPGTAGTYTNGGTGPITFANNATTGAPATLNLNLSQGITYTNPIAVTGSGLNTLNLANYFVTFSGPVTLGGNIVLSTTNPNNSTLTFNNTVTGTGNITTTIGGTNTGSNISFTNTFNPAGTLTNNGTGVAATNINGPVGSNFQGFIQDTTSSTLTLWNNTSTYTSGIVIKKGKVTSKSPNATGTGTITIGDVANTGTVATLDFNGNGAYNTSIVNPINVVGNGTQSISTTSWSPTLTGAITLNNNNLILLTSNPGGSNMAVDGGITGVGNLLLQNNDLITSGVSSSLAIRTGQINNIGTITHTGTGTVNGGSINTNISAPIGANVTSITQNSAISRLILSGASPSFAGNVAITSGTLQLTSAGILGLKVGAAGVNSTITGSGTALLDGTFAFNTAGAAQNTSWTIVPAGGTRTYSGTFKVATPAGVAYTKSGTAWTYTNSGVTYKYDQATGIFSTTGTPAGGFATWASDPANGLGSSERAATYDADGDGFNNLLEYFFGGNPKASSTAIAPVVTRVGSNLQVNFTRHAQSTGDTTAVVQWSTDLVTWSAGTAVTGSGPIVQTVPVSNAVNGKLFVRVKVTSTP
jgi:autotransporter-associated beta strand protein